MLEHWKTEDVTLVATGLLGVLQLYTALQVTRLKYWAVEKFVRRAECTHLAGHIERSGDE